MIHPWSPPLLPLSPDHLGRLKGSALDLSEPPSLSAHHHPQATLFSLLVLLERNSTLQPPGLCMCLFVCLLCCCSVTRSCLTFCDPRDCSTPDSPVLYSLPGERFRFLSIESVMLSTHLTLCHPLLLLPSIFPQIRLFSNELALPIRWPNYWSFSFSIRTSNEYSGLFSLRIDWFDLLLAQGTLKESCPAPQFKSISSLVVGCLYGASLTSVQN